MSEQTFFKMSGPIGGSLANIGATPDQLKDMAANVGGFSGPLVLSPSELADRLQYLPPECGGQEAVAALRMMDPDTRLLVSPDGPVTLGSVPSEAVARITPDNVTEGFYWVRSKTWPRTLNVMSVVNSYGGLHFAVPFLDDDMRGEGAEETFAHYEFICKIPEPA